MLSADNLCNQFGSRSEMPGLMWIQFDTVMVFLKDFFENFEFEKINSGRK